ncbi:hypothetical protein BV22DRAFT_1028195 [Leucogyrophana mollusca]|uniref:Uncharacterized protein n=1 Tax=Leucogyrophana mollusca TaxID=85980 RepID=A0ACB8BYH9_9AGAM|nr:hypothetical protein BV22DRAFT_1028195 [Leucogyrophana mollusca]
MLSASAVMNNQYPQQHAYAQQQAALAMGTLLPTPPSSPPTLPPVESTISLLESLVAFYHQERMWVYRTRASLELTLQERANGSANHAASASDESSPLTSDTEGTLTGRTPIKEEPHTPSEAPDSKWYKRKRAFGLKLEGISVTRGMPTVNNGGIAKQKHNRGRREPSVQMLELFESMMQARMESCERVTRMVRNAGNGTGGGAPQQNGGFPMGMQVR